MPNVTNTCVYKCIPHLRCCPVIVPQITGVPAPALDVMENVSVEDSVINIAKNTKCQVRKTYGKQNISTVLRF